MENDNIDKLKRWMTGEVRHDYCRQELLDIFNLPLPRLIYLAQTVHIKYWHDNKIQLCSLLSIKTGGCTENCAYCAQSIHHQAEISPHGLVDLSTVVAAAQEAKARGSTKLCMGAAWYTPSSERQFQKILEYSRAVREIGLEVCCTLGSLTEEQAQMLAAAGVTSYNHNLDTSREYYDKVVTTHSFADRLQTIKNVRKAGISVCSGGIIGMGESRSDRLGLLEELNHLEPHPEGVPINLLVKVPGTPLANVEDLAIFELVRMIATARVVMPRSRVSLAAGRTDLTDEAQALCFIAGANSIFIGDKLLTTDNVEMSQDQRLFEKLGLVAFAGELHARI